MNFVTLAGRCLQCLGPLFVGLLLVCIASSPAVSAGFDCRKAAGKTEKLICSEPALSELDSQLNQTYSSLLAQLEGGDAAKLRQVEQVWLITRNRCTTVGCLADRYQQRIEFMKRRLFKLQYADRAMEVVSAREQTYDNGASIVVRFSVPVDGNSDFRRFFTISRNREPQPSENWLLGENGFVAVYPFVEPSSKYEVSVQPGLQGINGQGQTETKHFKIATRRSEPSAGFADSGHVMTTGMQPALPVTTLNVNDVDLDIFRVAPQDIPRWSTYSNNKRRSFYELNTFSANNPLVYSGRFPIKNQRNQRTTTNLDLSEIPALNKVGAYFAVLKRPGRYNYQYDTSFFTVSDIGVQLHQNGHTLQVLCNSIATGSPLGSIELSVYRNSKLLARQQSDDEGLATIYLDKTDSSSQPNVLIAREGKQYTVLRLDRPLDLSGLRNAVTHHQQTQVFAWGPRDLYRPGEVVETYAVLRDFDGRGVPSFPVKAELLDPSAAW